MTPTLAAKSNQLTSDDLIAGPMTVKVTEVLPGSDVNRLVVIHFEGDQGKPYLPNVTMRRIIVAAWGKHSTAYIGRSMTLYRNPEVQYGKERVGGIEISHVSDIAAPVSIALTVRRGKKAVFTVQPLKVEPAADPVELAAAACKRAGLTPAGIEALCLEISKGAHNTLSELQPNILQRLAQNGVKPETVERCNATSEPTEEPTQDDEDLPAAWSA
jgi:hypothetical protein